MYCLLKYPLVKNLYMGIAKTLLKICMDALISAYALCGFFVYSVFAAIGLFTIKGFACGVQGFSFAAELLKMLGTCFFYLFQMAVDAASIACYPLLMAVKGFEAPLGMLLELFGMFFPEERLEEQTRFQLFTPIQGQSQRLIAFERVIAYSVGIYFFAFLIQKNIYVDMIWPLAGTAVAVGAVVAPFGLIFRRKIQEAVANWNRANQNILTQVAWVNNMGRNIKNLSLANAQLVRELDEIRVPVATACPWLEKFRADQLRIAANYLPVIGPMTNAVTANFRLSFRNQFLGLWGLACNAVQFLLCVAAVLCALFLNETEKKRAWFYVFFAAYVLWSCLENFDDVQDFTIEDYKLHWKKARAPRRREAQTEPLTGDNIVASYTSQPSEVIS